MSKNTVTRTEPDYVTARALNRVADWAWPICSIAAVAWLPFAVTCLHPAGWAATLLLTGAVPAMLIVTGLLASFALSSLANHCLAFDRRDLDALPWDDVVHVAGQMWRHYGGRFSPSDYELSARFWLARRQLWLPYEEHQRDVTAASPWGEPR
jgi:energy-converting hydrogenase Eha subunit G